MQIADNDAMRLRRRLQSLVLRQDKELKPQNPTTNDLRHSALFQVQDQVRLTAECIGSSRCHRRKPVAACGNKKLWESSEISITKRLEPTVAVWLLSNQQRAGLAAISPPTAGCLLHQTSSHLLSEARDKSSKPRPAAQAHWLELSKVNMLCLPFLS